jgi:methyl-accepting chemotaxis protein
MKIQSRIYLLCALGLSAGAAAAVYLVLGLSQANGKYASLLQTQVRQSDMARLMQVTFKKQVQSFKDILLRGEAPADLKKYTEEFRANARIVDQMGEQLASSSESNPAIHEKILEFIASHQDVDAKYEAALQGFVESNASNPHAADASVRGRDRPATNLCDDIVALYSKSVTLQSEELRSTISRQIAGAWAALFASLLGLSVLSTLTIRRISGSIRSAVENLRNGSHQVSSSASQVAGSSEALADSSARQAAAIEETSSAAGEIHSMARRNTETCQQTAAIVAESQQGIERANQSLSELVAAMEGIGSSSAKIGKIIKLIDDVAFQTNILALNAAVEAARAGEAGMGFAVVADEVRSLAQRCAQAARDTAPLIEESMRFSQGGRQKVEQVAESVQGMTAKSSQIMQHIEEISLASVEQSRGIEQISRSISQMEESTQTNAATAEEGSAASRQLEAHSHDLTDVVASLAAMV